MKILIVSQYFWPETFKINDLAITLHELGHEITVLTGKPNYPIGKFYKGYSFFKRHKEDYCGIKIVRVPLVARGKNNKILLALNYLSFAFIAGIFTMFYRKKFDISLSFSTSPITSVIPAILHKKINNYGTLTWIQDLWPESVTATTKIRSKILIAILEGIVKYVYRNSDKILVQSKAFNESICKYGRYESKIEYLPNWAEDIYFNKSSANFEKYKNLIPNGFVVMFAGNIGEAQDFNSILKAAELTKHDKNIKWVILGDGRNKEFVCKEVERLGLQETFLLLGSYPMADMPGFFIHADLMLVALKDEYIFSLTIPSKVQSYMASGKPIVSMINGIGNEIITDARCGLTANAGDYESLADNVIKLSKQPKELLNEFGTNSKAYYEANFSKKIVIDNLLTIMESHVNKGN